jgi:hypothetical protein
MALGASSSCHFFDHAAMSEVDEPDSRINPCACAARVACGGGSQREQNSHRCVWGARRRVVSEKGQRRAHLALLSHARAPGLRLLLRLPLAPIDIVRLHDHAHRRPELRPGRWRPSELQMAATQIAPAD